MTETGSMPGTGGASGAQASGPEIPPAVLRSWDEAEARLFPQVMARPDLYQQSISMIGRILGRLRETCQDLPTLVAAHERGGGLAAEDPAAEDQASSVADGVRPDLVAAAACAMRYRELVASQAAHDRLAALARARAEGLPWVVVQETGSPDRAPYVPYQRIEAEVASGRAVIVSIEPDETLSRAVHRLDEGWIDGLTGRLRIGDVVGTYLDQDAFAAALRQARNAPVAAPPPI
jgi:hypothetical protein